MINNKESLVKLMQLVEEISNQPGNEWFRNAMKIKYASEAEVLNSSAIEEIYEYCIKLIVKDQAEKFYSDFKLRDVKRKLIEDFIRMEKFRREDNFEDFCLAVFQQIEGIVNRLCTDELHESFLTHMYEETHKVKNKVTGQLEPQTLWKLVLYPDLSKADLLVKASKKLSQWDFLERCKLILYFYYYNGQIYNHNAFLKYYFFINDLYQSRNLNHRGGTMRESQEKVINNVTSNKYKYYFKFLGLLEDFTTTVNSVIIIPED
jgi:hypothetical protein